MKKLLNLDSLTKQESFELFNEFSSYHPEKQAAILALLTAKKETPHELMGAYLFYKKTSTVITHELDVVDIVGTGGDGAGTFNISTAASLILAGCGVLIAKHGGKSATSKTGSQDVIDALGIKVAANAKECLANLAKTNYAYLSAPIFNQGLKSVGSLRKTIGFPSIFNVLGPLLNPMRPKRFIIGVYRRDLVKKMGEIVKTFGPKHALIVHSDEGLDEISISSDTYVLEIKEGVTKTYTLSPEDFGLKRGKIADIKGSGAVENANIILQIIKGSLKGPKLDIVLLNSAAGLYVSGKVTSIKEGVNRARAAIEEGRAFSQYQKIKGE